MLRIGEWFEALVTLWKVTKWCDKACKENTPGNPLCVRMCVDATVGP